MALLLKRPRPGHHPRHRGRPGDHATAWLKTYMAAHGPVISTQMIADATAAGINTNALYLARHDLGVRLERVPGRGARLVWS